MLLKGIGHFVPWWQLAIILGAANFLTLVTPFAGGGGALVIYYLYRRGIGVPAATALVTAGGIAGQIGLATLVLVMFSTLKAVPPALAPYLQLIRFAALAYIGVLIVLMLIVVKSERWLQWLSKRRGFKGRSAAWFGEFQSVYRLFATEKQSNYLTCMAIAFIYYIVYYLAGFILLTGFGAFSGWLRYAISVLFGIAPVFSPIPGGAGASELIVFLVLEEALAADALGTFILLWRTVVFYLPIIFGGSIFAFLIFRWAAQPLPKQAEGANQVADNSPGVILSDDNDHNR